MPDHLDPAVMRMTGQQRPEMRREPPRLEKTIDFNANRADCPRGNLIDEPDKTHGRKAA